MLKSRDVAALSENVNEAGNKLMREMDKYTLDEEVCIRSIDNEDLTKLITLSHTLFNELLRFESKRSV